jgi:hypothetical protein
MERARANGSDDRRVVSREKPDEDPTRDQQPEKPGAVTAECAECEREA